MEGEIVRNLLKSCGNIYVCNDDHEATVLKITSVKSDVSRMR